jgi:DNA-directed RNA polymerase alpha subunit
LLEEEAEATSKRAMLMRSPIEELGLGVVPTAGCRRTVLPHIEDLVEKSSHDLLAIANFIEAA